MDMKDYARAEDYHTRGLKLSRENNDNVKEAHFLLNLANDQTMLGKLDEAKIHYDSALEVAKSLNNPDLNWRIIAGMAEYNEQKGKYEKAVQLNDSALKILDGMRNTLKSKEQKASYMASERYAFEDIIDLLETLYEKDKTKGYDRLAFSYAESSKSRVLLDLLSESLSDVSKNVPLEPANARNAQPVTIDEVEALLPDRNTVILEYSVGDSSSCLWVITKSGHKLYKLPARKKLQEQIETIRFALLDPQQSISEFFTQAGISLFNELIKPAEPFLSKKSKVVIIPDGVLNYLPFEVLLTENKKLNAETLYTDIPFLVKKYPISYGQSASVLKTLISQKVPGKESGIESKKLLAFGDPLYEDTLLSPRNKYPRLEYSGREIEYIASNFQGGSPVIYLRNNATEENLKRNNELEKFNYIHFAVHGLIDEDKPDLSSLVLTSEKNSGEDGFLQAAEIFNLKLNADLVVLSACQTGLGKLVRGEGMVGLTRSFMYAGTPSVVVSLWSVSDMSTAALMGEFYKNLIKNKLSKTDALRQAQLTLMRDEKYAHPFYWAPFILIGDWR
jgi:CHAT domain-containing protein